jgi:hypothetical protein
MQMLQYLPVKAFDMWHHIPRFFVNTAGPAFGSSASVFSKVADVASLSSGSGEDSSSQGKNRRRIEDDYGLSQDIQIELQSLAAKAMFGEDTVGANSEALQCLKKGPGVTWGACDDYAVLVAELVKLERNIKITNGGGESKLKIKAFFAESDIMIGKKGQSYFEECWKSQQGEFQDVFEFSTETIDGVDHDRLTQSVAALEPALIDAGGVLNNMTG